MSKNSNDSEESMTTEQINAMIKRLKDLKKSKKEPRKRKPAQTEEELVEREMMRLRAKEEAKRRMAAERQVAEQRAIEARPVHAGLWRERNGTKMVSVSEHGTCISYSAGKLVGATYKVSQLVGEWDYVGQLHSNKPEPTRVIKESAEHAALTKAHRERTAKLLETNQKPCGNFRCDAVLEYVDPRRFCESCEAMFNSAN